MRFEKFSFKDKSNKKDKCAIFENILFGTCIAGFLVLLVIQIVLLFPSFRSTFTMDKSLGIPLSENDYLYKRGQLTLEMSGKNTDPAVKILVNGEAVAAFDKLMVNINVNEGDVIEIDGSQSTLEHTIKVQSISSNINNNCKNMTEIVKSKIKKILKVQFYE